MRNIVKNCSSNVDKILTTVYDRHMSASQTLKKLGLNEKEARVYLALLRRGKSKPAELAKLTKLNRATLYHTAKNLVSRGIIAEDLSGKALQFVTLPIDNLKYILESDTGEADISYYKMKKKSWLNRQ